MADDDKDSTPVNPVVLFAERDLKAGYNELKAERYDNAIALFSKCLDDLQKTVLEEAKSLRAAAYNGRGLAFYEQHEYKFATQDFSKAISINPNEAEFHSNLGGAFNSINEHDLAIESFSTASKLSPEEENLYFNRGIAYRNKGEYDLAIKDYDKAIELNPQKPDFYSNRGNVYGDKGEHERAIDDYNKAIELNPNDPRYYFNRGTAYDDMGKKDLSIKEYDKAIELNPKEPSYYYNRGTAYGDKGDFGRAVEDYDKAIELDKTFTQAYHNRALAIAKREGEKSAEIYRVEMEKQLATQLESIANQDRITKEYQGRAKELREIIQRKEEILTRLTYLTQGVVLIGFIYIAYFTVFSTYSLEISIPAKILPAYFLFVGFVTSLYLVLSEIRRRRKELMHYIAAEHDAFRKGTLAQYPLFFPNDQEKRYKVTRQFMMHASEKSPAEFILDWRIRESRHSKKSKNKDKNEEGESHTQEGIDEIIEKAASAAAKEAAAEVTGNNPS